MPLVTKAVTLTIYSIFAVMLEATTTITDVSDSFVKMTWGGLLAFTGWFVVSVYKDYKEFKKAVYPKFENINTRLTIIESKIDNLKNEKADEIPSKKLRKK